MEKETYTSKHLLRYLQILAKKYNTEGIWLVKKCYKRWDFVIGIRGGVFTTPTLVTLDDKYGIFIEKTEEINDHIDRIKSEIMELLYAN